MTTAMHAGGERGEPPLLLIVGSADGRVLRFSDGFREALDYEPEELCGRDWKQLVHPADVAAGRAWGAGTLRDGTASPLLARMRHRSGSYRVFEWTALAVPGTELVFAAGRPAGGTGPVTDESSNDGIELDVRGRRLFVAGTEIELTAIEFDLLTLLLGNRGTVVSANRIAREVWGYQTAGNRNFLQAHVSRLRSKLDGAGLPDAITTVRGVGYVIR